MQVLEVVDTDRDEHEVGIDQGLGRDEADGLPGGDAAPGTGLPVHRRVVTLGEPYGELTGDGRPVVPDGVSRRDAVAERHHLHAPVAGADPSRDAVGISEPGDRADEPVPLERHEGQAQPPPRHPPVDRPQTRGTGPHQTAPHHAPDGIPPADPAPGPAQSECLGRWECLDRASDKNIDARHERRPFHAHGHLDVVTLGDFTLGRGVFEPGWRWSDDVKPG